MRDYIAIYAISERPCPLSHDLHFRRMAAAGNICRASAKNME